MFMAISNRKPHVNFFTAANGFNLLFWSDYYTDKGNEWCRTYSRCMLSFALLVTLLLVLNSVFARMH